MHRPEQFIQRLCNLAVPYTLLVIEHNEGLFDTIMSPIKYFIDILFELIEIRIT